MLIVVLFSIQNAQSVTFSFLIGKINIPLALIIISSAIIGALLATFAGIARRYQLLKEIGKQKSQIQDLEKQIDLLEKKIVPSEEPAQPDLSIKPEGEEKK